MGGQASVNPLTAPQFQLPPDADAPRPLSRAATWAGAAGGIVTALVLAYLLAPQFGGPLSGFSESTVREQTERGGILAPLLFVVLLAACVVFAPIPNTPFHVAAGIIWGPVWGSLLAMAGMAAGSFVAYGLARRFGRKHVQRLAGRGRLGQMERAAGRVGPWAVFWARLLPATNYDWINYLAGLTAVRPLPFMVATLLGILPATVATVVAGAAIQHRPWVSAGLTAVWLAALLVSTAFIARRRRL